MITNEVMDIIFENQHHKISRWNPHILSPPLLQQYADVIHAKGAPLENCFGFIDGTVRPIARPGQHQRIVYNGHKRVHSLKFQSVTLPNGLIANMYGPVGKLIPLFSLDIVFILVLDFLLLRSNGTPSTKQRISVEKLILFV